MNAFERIGLYGLDEELTIRLERHEAIREGLEGYDLDDLFAEPNAQASLDRWEGDIPDYADSSRGFGGSLPSLWRTSDGKTYDGFPRDQRSKHLRKPSRAAVVARARYLREVRSDPRLVAGMLAAMKKHRPR